ncbi:polyprenyl synthetase family protein [Kolteria novifilia]|uniref:polyprenyl synthetase family protein n=1 Tax=Kolteria novifilia TaxID=2527975 RepID=UPI003AF3D9CB
MTKTDERQALDSKLAAIYEPVANDLLQAEEVFNQEIGSDVAFVEELTSRVRRYQGKRLRPALLLLTGKAVGNVNRDHHVLAAVVEMIHIATLVHDDVLDDAALRRHVTTVNAEWGNEASVLLGDFLFTHSFHLAASLESTLACRLIGQATNRVCEGELHQIARRGCFELSESEYIDIIAGKTAELISCCCRLGAHFAGASDEVTDSMTEFGREIGIAFQIADDVIDLTSSEATAGKSLGSDLLKQKTTLPLIRFRQTAEPDVLERFRNLFEHPESADRTQIARDLNQSDALSYAHGKAAEFAARAARRLDALPRSSARDVLESLTRFVADRVA